jgi:D-glycero-alpha-D-manno-heptose-7-phosphate kinase
MQLFWDAAISAGASGGKILGAGGGGFFLFWVPIEMRTKFNAQMRNLKNVPFQISTKGTERIFSN